MSARELKKTRRYEIEMSKDYIYGVTRMDRVRSQGIRLRISVIENKNIAVERKNFQLFRTPIRAYLKTACV